jgi:hypothetical protein
MKENENVNEIIKDSYKADYTIKIQPNLNHNITTGLDLLDKPLSCTMSMISTHKISIID